MPNRSHFRWLPAIRFAVSAMFLMFLMPTMHPSLSGLEILPLSAPGTGLQLAHQERFGNQQIAQNGQRFRLLYWGCNVCLPRENNIYRMKLLCSSVLNATDFIKGCAEVPTKLQASTQKKDEICRGCQDSDDCCATCWLRAIAGMFALNELLNSVELWLISDMQHSQENWNKFTCILLETCKADTFLLSFTAISPEISNKNMSTKLLNKSQFHVGKTICILHFTYLRYFTFGFPERLVFPAWTLRSCLQMGRQRTRDLETHQWNEISLLQNGKRPISTLKRRFPEIGVPPNHPLQ